MLQIAAERGPARLVRLLIERGASLRSPSAEPTPLQTAVRAGKLARVKALLAGLPSAQDVQNGVDALAGSPSPRLDILAALCEAGGSLVHDDSRAADVNVRVSRATLAC